MIADKRESFRGEWWLPIRPHHRVPGTLVLDPVQGAQLSINGSFVKPQLLSSTYHEVILGEAAFPADLVTLHHCNATKSSVPVRGGVPPHFEFSAHTAWMGAHFPDTSDTRFRNLIVEIDALGEWLRPEREHLDVEFDESTGVIRVTPSDGPATNLEVKWRDYSIRLHAIAAQAPLGGMVHGPLTISSNASLIVEATEEKPLADLFSVVRALQRLVILGLDRPCQITGFWGTTARAKRAWHDGSEIERPVAIHSKGIPLGNPRGESSHFSLFHATTFQEAFELMVTNWLDASEKLQPVYDLVFFPFESPAVTQDLRFLQLMHAVEAHHRRTRGGEHLARKLYREEIMPRLVAAIPETVDNDLRTAIRDRLRYANEYSLRDRLFQIVGGHTLERFFSGVHNPEEFIHEVRSLRNYLTHLSEESRPDAEKLFSKLPPRIAQLEMILTITLLRDLGLDDEGIRAIMVKHPKRNYLNYFLHSVENPESERKRHARREVDEPPTQNEVL